MGNNEDFWIPIVLFLSIAVVSGLVVYFRFRMRREFQQTIRIAFDKGQELTPDLLQNLGGEPKPGNGDLRKGFIYVAIGVGLGVFGIILGEKDAVRPMLATGSLPLLVGFAYLALWRFGGKQT
ncbi:MAG: DUF6249 domain-containing protein [Pseudomonadota bacterium]